MTTENPVSLLTRKEVARRLSMSKATVSRLAQTGDLPSIKFSARGIRFYPEDVEKFIESKRSTISK